MMLLAADGGDAHRPRLHPLTPETSACGDRSPSPVRPPTRGLAANDIGIVATSVAAEDFSMGEFAKERKHLARFFIEIESARRSVQIAASHTDVTTNAPAGLFVLTR
jgi:hypothetical protein